MKNEIFKLLVEPVGNLVGHRTLFRAGAFLMRAGRFDFPNSIGQNGEKIVQNSVLIGNQDKELVVVDCGANMGQWSTQLSSTIMKTGYKGRLKAFCFEPSSFTFERLHESISKIQIENVEFKLIQKALSSKSGRVNLKIVHNGAGVNSLVGVPENYSSEELVEVTTIDVFSKENDLQRIDLLKIDAEGHDFDVIVGAKEMITKNKIELIQFEYNWRWIYGKHFLQEAFEFFNSCDYILGKITPKGIQFYSNYNIELESFVEGNFLACSKLWKDRFSIVSNWFEKF